MSLVVQLLIWYCWRILSQMREDYCGEQVFLFREVVQKLFYFKDNTTGCFQEWKSKLLLALLVCLWHCSHSAGRGS